MRLTSKEADWFWSGIQIIDFCWVWQRGRGSYGHAQGPSGWFTYRWAYIKFRGRIPKGKVLDHVVCDNPSCVNPWHVEPRTQRQNVLRGLGPSAQNARKTHCNAGHEFTPQNTWTRKQRGRKHLVRVCRECSRIRWRKWNAERA